MSKYLSRNRGRQSRKYKSRGPEFLRDLQEQMFMALRDSGTQAGLAEDIAHDIARRMCEHWGGLILYFPKGDFLVRRDRDVKMFKDWLAGVGIQDIAQRYNTSEQHAYRIIDWMRADDMARRQPELNLE